MISLFPTRTIVVSIGSFGIHWYGIMYLIAFSITLLLIPRLQKFRSLQLSKDTITTLVTWSILGVIIGGRLGYVVFYEFSYFLQNPIDIFAVWHGGMSSHGGFIGVSIALYYAMKKNAVPILPFLDVITVPIALGLACGRIGNFINLELYGTVTSLPWAIAIPGVEGLRHPTQIYAVIQDLCIAIVCFSLLRNSKIFPGIAFSVFLMMYAVLRTTVEVFRVPTHSVIDLHFIMVTRGQLLSVPIFIIGVSLLLIIWRRAKSL